VIESADFVTFVSVYIDFFFLVQSEIHNLCRFFRISEFPEKPYKKTLTLLVMYNLHRDKMMVSCHRKADAPLVNYQDYGQFTNMCQIAQDQYSELIANVLHSRRQIVPGNQWPVFSQRELMMIGLGEFCDLREGGMRILLRLTKGRGLRFCHTLNDNIINAVTTACRTYVNTINTLRMLTTDVTFVVNMQAMMGCMLDAFMLSCGNCDTHTGKIGHELFKRNFVLWGSAYNPFLTYCPRTRLPEYMVAFAMVTHEKLQSKTNHILKDDVLQLIFSYLHGPVHFI